MLFSGSQGNFTENAEGTEGRGEDFINLTSAPLALLSDLGELPFPYGGLVRQSREGLVILKREPVRFIPDRGDDPPHLGRPCPMAATCGEAGR
jgi:hypothetical protein